MDTQIKLSEGSSEKIYTMIRSSVITAQNRVYSAVNYAMVTAYWEIGEQIFKACGESDRAEYGKNLLKYLSSRLTAEFGKCFVLFDLKTDKLTHQDIGQMQMYVNYYTRELMNEGDNPPIGIVLCAEKNDAVVRYTLPEDNNQIFASKYFTYLPTEEELKRELRTEAFLKIDDEK